MDYYDLEQLPFLGPEQVRREDAAPEPGTRYRVLSFLLAFVLLFATWILLSGKFDAFHLSLGIIASLLVAWTSRDLLFVSGTLAGLHGISWRMMGYIPWLLYQVTLANIHVFKLSLSRDPRQSIDPHIIRLHTRLKSELAIVTYANSITLTPGTITLQTTVDGEVRIHALDYTAGDREALRRMEEKVARVFKEE
ncbi:MAG: Na+/H+ antiporter subunit E [Desulfatibacillaceae bacterium]